MNTKKVFGVKEFAAGKSTVIFPALAYLIARHRGVSVFTVVSHDYFSYKHAKIAASILSRQGLESGL